MGSNLPDEETALKLDEADPTLMAVDDELTEDGQPIEEPDEKEEPEELESDEVEGEEPEEEEEAEPELDPRLVHAAEWAGLSADALQAMPEEARQSVLAKLADAEDKFSRDLGLLGQQVQKPAEQPKPEPRKTGQAGAALDEPFSYALNDEAKEILGEDATKQLTEPAEQYINTLRSEMVALREQVQTQQEERLLNQADEVFSKYPQYEDTFGKGKTTALSEESEQGKARIAVFQLADQMMAGANSKGIRLNTADAIQRAIFIQTYDRAQELARKELAGKTTKRGKQAISRPTQKQTKRHYASPDAKATEVAKEKMEELGMSPEV